MFIAIEGCVGAGKSTVTTGLARLRSSRGLLENFQDNPFLESFYENQTENALETEFAFLLLHFHQLKAEKRFALESELIADFHLGKDILYAKLNLKDAHALVLFEQLFELCTQSTPVPSLLVYLAASTELLVQRISSRKREFETQVDHRYFAGINAAYEEYFAQYSGRKLRILMDEWDFVKDERLYAKLSMLIDHELAECEEPR